MKFPSRSDIYCQYITPALQFKFALALLIHLPSYAWLTHPVFAASLYFAGFPTIIFYKGTPLDAISLTEVPEKYEPDFKNRFSYESYFVLPWL